MANIIKAHRKGETRNFFVDVWNALPADKYGWKQSVQTPVEVAEMMKQLEESGNQLSKNQNPENPLPGSKFQFNVTQTIDKLKTATLETIETILEPGENRITVLNAFEFHKNRLLNAGNNQ